MPKIIRRVDVTPSFAGDVEYSGGVKDDALRFALYDNEKAVASAAAVQGSLTDEIISLKDSMESLKDAIKEFLETFKPTKSRK